MQLPIGEVIYKLRKEKGVTQEQLAKEVGVSVAAVSKWESKNSYPDITILPAIARYFNTTIDKLLRYEISISNEEIMEIVNKCAKIFENSSVEEGVNACESYLQQYPNSLNMKFRIGSLYMMYFSKAEDEEGIISFAKKSISLLEKSSLSEDVDISQASNYILSSLYSMIGEEEKAEKVLLKIPKNDMDIVNMLVPLYIKQEKYDEAKKLLQEELLKKISSIIMSLSSYVNICKKENDIMYAREILSKQRELIKLFNIEFVYLNTNSMLFSEMCTENGDYERACDYIEEFVEGMKYLETRLLDNKMFNKIEFKEPIQSREYLRYITKKSLEENPAYEPLKNIDRYKNILDKL